MKNGKWAVSIGIVAQLFLPSAHAEDNFSSPSERADRTSFIWFSGNQKSDKDIANAIGILSAEWKKLGFGDVQVDDDDDGDTSVFVDKPANEVRDILKSLLGPEDDKVPYSVEPNGVAFSFANCTDARRKYAGGPYLDWGVKRVWRNTAPKDYSTNAAVWIIDSGIAADLVDELRVKSILNCTNMKKPYCSEDGQKTDIVGHGTMIAGIIGAKNNDLGVTGVAPGAPINSLRVTTGSTGEVNLDHLSRTLSWIRQNSKTDTYPWTPSPGDVINLSLGSPWVSTRLKTHKSIEKKLRSLANLGFRISVAAGNADALRGLGYVSAISPARAGGYRSQNGGMIATTSAINDKDWFWQYSAFGNYYTDMKKNPPTQALSLPDYALPGVDVVSLWPGPDVAKCTGTSVAAAHLSGILLWDKPVIDGKALYDKSAEIPGARTAPEPGNPGGYDEHYYDPIAVVKQ